MEGTGSEQRLVRDAARLRAVMGRTGDEPRRPKPGASFPLPEIELEQSDETTTSSTEGPQPEVTATPSEIRPTRMKPVTVRPGIPVEEREHSPYETHLRPVVLPNNATTSREVESEEPHSTSQAFVDATTISGAYGADAHEREMRGMEDTPTIRLDENIHSSTVPLVRTRTMRGFRPLAGLAIVVGLGVGIGLYATFGDEISSLFSPTRESLPPGDPAMVTERPVDVNPALQPSDAITGSIAEPLIDSAELARLEAIPGEDEIPTPSATPHANREPVPEQRRAAARTPAVVEPSEVRRVSRSEPGVGGATTTRERGPREQAARESAPREASAREVAARRPVVTEIRPAAAATRYTVQIRSTSDESEATRIAQRLRTKGAKNVRVEKWKKDGAEMYRVRYGAFASSSEAQAESERLGQGNVWIVKRP